MLCICVMKRSALPFVFLALTGASLPQVGKLSESTLRTQLVAAAAAVSPADLAFERVTRLERKGGGSKVKQTRIERWDGAHWTLVSINGAVPSSAERAKAARDDTVPGYHQLARIMAAATEQWVDANGRTVLLVPELPKGSVVADGRDISEHLRGEAVLGARGGAPWVERLTVTARETFKLNLLIKVTNFEQVNDYRLDPNGHPRLVAQANGSVGTMFGISGGETSEVLFAYR
jgi:hypothetical protein